MGLSQDIIQAIDNLLGVMGQPHFADIPHTQLATACMMWELPYSPEPGGVSGIDESLANVRRALVNLEAIGFKSVDWWWGPYETKAHKIVVGPSRDQFDILKLEMGPSPYSDSDYYATELRKYGEEYGIDITGAGYKTIEFTLKRIPLGQEAVELSDRILKFAPDVIQGSGRPLTMLDFEHSKGRIALWWD